LDNLKAFVEIYNETHKPKLKLGVTVFFVGLINELKSHFRIDKIIENEFIPLDSQILKKYHSNSKNYLDFLVNFGVLEKQNYSTDKGRSNSYRINDKYKNDELISFDIEYDKLNEKFNENGLDKHQQKKLEFSIDKRPHLMKIFNDKLTIDVDSACNEIKHLNDSEPKRYNNAMVLINEFKNKTWKASFKPYKSDFRLHTNLTRSPKVLRKHILINNENIIGYDVKTSQPYFFCVVLKAILKKDEELLKKIGATKILNESNIEQLFDLEIDRDEVTNFVLSVIDKEVDFYDDFATKLDIKIDENGQPFRMISNFKKNNQINSRSKQKEDLEPQTKKSFDTKRNLAKEVVMEIFYSSPNSKTNEAAMFRKAYPSIHKIIKCLFDNGVKFHQLLTTIEAYVLLDIVAKKISDKYPNMPLGSIHDCLITNNKHKHQLRKEMSYLIKEVTTLEVKIEIEDWNQQH
jgi:hypothetical protein